MTTPIYRDYNANLQAPYINARKGLFVQGLPMFTPVYGTKPVPTTSHTITAIDLPVLSKPSWCGTITLFFSTTDQQYQHVLMAVVIKNLGSNIQAVTYQKVGNLATCILAGTGTSILTVTTSVPTQIVWSCQSPFL
jgi:hypothetical protein